MDRKNAFNALFKAVRLGHHVAPPPGETLDRVDTLVLAVCVYIQGLGYDIVASGSKAEAYFAEQQGEQVQPYSSSSTAADGGMQGWRDLKGSGVYAFVMSANFGGIRDQTCVRCLVVGEDRVVVHCSRSAWDEHHVSLDSERIPQVLRESTSCSYKNVSTIDLKIDSYVDNDGSVLDVDAFLSIMEQALCKKPALAEETARPDVRDDTHDTETASTSVRRDTRVGYGDVDALHAQGHDGGMLVGPHHPIFGPGRLEPSRPEQQGTLPPGARWDPIAPPGMRGFFPGDFQRRRPPSSQPHPDVMPRGDPADGPPEYM